MAKLERAGLSEAAVAYDAIAHRYSSLWQDNPIIAHSSRVSLHLVTRAMANCSFLLEIGAGVGRETLPLAAQGKHVVACDPSEESLRLLRREAERLGLADRIDPRPLSASLLSKLEDEYGKGAFDGCLSSFALSYEPSLRRIPETLAVLLKPGAPLLCSILNRLCLTELALLAPILVPRRGFGRLLGTVEMSVDRALVAARAYFPWEILRLFEGRFALDGVWAIPAIIPPHYFHRIIGSMGQFRSRLEELDWQVSGRRPFRYLGSHTAFLFRLIG